MIHEELVERMEASKSPKKNNKVALVIVLLLLFIGIIAYFYWNRNIDPVIDKDATTYTPAVQRPEDLANSKILVPGQDTWYMDEETDEIKVTLGNPEGNSCYFQYSVIQKDTQEELCKTDLIPAGNAVQSIKTSKVMKAGTYPIIVRIKTFDIDNPKVEFNNAEVETELVVLKEETVE